MFEAIIRIIGGILLILMIIGTWRESWRIIIPSSIGASIMGAILTGMNLLSSIEGVIVGASLIIVSFLTVWVYVYNRKREGFESFKFGIEVDGEKISIEMGVRAEKGSVLEEKLKKKYGDAYISEE